MTGPGSPTASQMDSPGSPSQLASAASALGGTDSDSESHRPGPSRSSSPEVPVTPKKFVQRQLYSDEDSDGSDWAPPRLPDSSDEAASLSYGSSPPSSPDTTAQPRKRATTVPTTVPCSQKNPSRVAPLSNVPSATPDTVSPGAIDVPSTTPDTVSPGAIHEKKKRRQHTKRRESNTNRVRFRCVLPNVKDPTVECGATVENMNRHYDQVHSYRPSTEQMCAKIVQSTNAPPSPKECLNKGKRYPRIPCPVQGCNHIGVRPELYHCTHHHRMTKEDIAAVMPQIRAARLASHALAATPPITPTTTTLKSILNSFETWLFSPEGGKWTTDDDSAQRKTNIRRGVQRDVLYVGRIIKLTCGEVGFSPERMLWLRSLGRSRDEGGIIEVLQNKYKLKWGTVRNHLISLHHFINYLQASRHVLGDWVTDEYIHQMRNTQKGTLASLSKRYSEDERARMQDMDEGHISRDALIHFLGCIQISSVTEHLDLVARGRQDIIDTYANRTMIRDALITLLAVTNGKRSGIYGCITKQAVIEASEKHGLHQVTVYEGKTMSSVGPSVVNIDATLHRALISFALHYGSSTEKGLFVTGTGNPLDSSAVTKSLGKGWAMGLEDAPVDIVYPEKISMNLVRRSLVTLARTDWDFSKEDQETLARHMGHSMATANRTYDLSRGRSISVQCAALLRTAMKSAPAVDPIPSDDEDDADNADIHPAGSASPSRQSAIAPPASDIRAPTSLPEVTSRAPAKLFGKNRIFKEDDGYRLKRCTAAYIANMVTTGGPVRRDEVLRHVREAGKNYMDLLNIYTPVQLTERVRNWVRAGKKKSRRKTGTVVEDAEPRRTGPPSATITRPPEAMSDSRSESDS